MVVVPLPSCPLACPLALWPPCPPRPLPRARLKQVAARPPPGSRSRGGLIGPAALGRPGQCRNRSRQLPRRLCRPQLRPPRPRRVSGAPGLTTNRKSFQTSPRGPTGPTDRVKGHRRPQRQERSKQPPWSVSRQRRRRPRALACWLSFRRRQRPVQTRSRRQNRSHRLRRRPLRSRKGRERPCP